MSRRPSVPITVVVPERHQVELLQRCAADPAVMLIASGETLAGAGLLGLLRVGRAMVIVPDVASLTPSCHCCQVRLDLIDAVRYAVLRRTPPERLVVVVDRADAAPMSPSCADTQGHEPVSDVLTAITTLHASSEVERLAHLGGLVVEVDACAASTRLASGLALWDGQVEAALAIADSIVVTGAEFLTDEARTAVAHSLRVLNHIGEVSFCRAASIDAGHLVDLDVWNRTPASAAATQLASAIRGTWPQASPTHLETAIETVVLHRGGVLEPEATNAWLDRVVAESPRDLLRLQAALRVSTHHSRVCVGGSRSTMRSSHETHTCATQLANAKGGNESVVVLIGRRLDRRALTESFESIEVER